MGAVETTTIPGLAGLSPEEVRRYARHLILPEVGREGQEKLKAARVLVVGAGGLGSPAALYLAAAGVGTLGSWTSTSSTRRTSTGRSSSARETSAAASSNGGPEAGRDQPPCDPRDVRERLTSSNALESCAATTSWPTAPTTSRRATSSTTPACFSASPMSTASVFRFEGQASVFWAAKGPCYRCLYPEPPPPGLVPSCAEGGVLGVLPGSSA